MGEGVVALLLLLLLHWCLESGELVRQRRVGRDSECGIDEGVEKSEKVEVILGVGWAFS